MAVLTGRPQINEVFTPRGAVINKSIYIERPELEKELARALNGSLHAIIYGESGSGKSWLYKKVSDDLSWRFVVANCANASRVGSLTKEICDCVMPHGKPTLGGYTETKGANIVGAKLEHQKKFDVRSREPLLDAFGEMNKQSGGQTSVLVLDNLESIFKSEKHMEELGNVITLLDDQRYAQHRVKILIVGVPSGVIEYFSKTANLHTVANRLQEITEVRNLSEQGCHLLTKLGFRDLLKIEISDFDFENWQDHIYAVTFGIPQRVHEYCEQLAYIVQDSKWKGKLSQIDQADAAWLRIGLKESYQVVERLMNERETKAGRRNQVLYALGKISARTFNSARVEEVLRNHFPNSTAGVTLGIGQIMAELAEKENSIIKRTPKGDAFQFTDTRYVMAIRVMLRASDGEKISKVEL